MPGTTTLWENKNIIIRRFHAKGYHPWNCGNTAGTVIPEYNLKKEQK